MNKVKKKCKLFIYLALGVMIGATGGILFYSRIPSSSKTIQELINSKFCDFPDYQFNKELFSVIDKGYLMVFYLNPSNQAAAALFGTKNADWENNYISNSGCASIPNQNAITYPLVAQGIQRSDENIFVWGMFNNPKVEKVIVCGQQATVIKLDNMNLWFSIVTNYLTCNNSEAMFYDKDKSLIKSIYF